MVETVEVNVECFFRDTDAVATALCSQPRNNCPVYPLPLSEQQQTLPFRVAGYLVGDGVNNSMDAWYLYLFG